MDAQLEGLLYQVLHHLPSYCDFPLLAPVLFQIHGQLLYHVQEYLSKLSLVLIGILQSYHLKFGGFALFK